MITSHHIIFAKGLSEKLNAKNKYNINKNAFTLGAVAPDLKCILPKHHVDKTIHRIGNKVKIINNCDSELLKSFYLGIISHYICDYFCMAHNNGYSGPKHRIYEKELYELYKNKSNCIKYDKSLDKLWVTTLRNNRYFVMSDMQSINSDEHSRLIENIIIDLNKAYLIESSHIDNIQIYRDIKYEQFVCETIIQHILEPVKCLAKAA